MISLKICINTGPLGAPSPGRQGDGGQLILSLSFPPSNYYYYSFLHGCRENSISSNFEFYLINVLVYNDIDQGIHKLKLKVALNEKWKKLYMGFHIPTYLKYDKWSISVDN